MGRPQRAIDPSSGPTAEFASALRALREGAGTPKYSSMAARAGRSSTALSEAAAGRHLPTWETTEAYVLACGGDVREWHRRWQEARAADTPGPGTDTADTDPAGPDDPLAATDRTAIEFTDDTTTDGRPTGEGSTADGTAPSGPARRQPGLRPRRAWTVAALAVAVAAVAVLSAYLVSVSGPSTAATPTQRGSGLAVADGADPKDSGCALDPEVTTLDSAEVDYDGRPTGMVELRYSPLCGVAWPRFEPFPKADIPKSSTVHVDVVRPQDHNLRLPFQAPYTGVAVYGNVVSSTQRCVFAAGWIDGLATHVPESRTHCFRGRTYEHGLDVVSG